jgi:hypothetical protein
MQPNELITYNWDMEAVIALLGGGGEGNMESTKQTNS